MQLYFREAWWRGVRRNDRTHNKRCWRTNTAILNSERVRCWFVCFFQFPLSTPTEQQAIHFQEAKLSSRDRERFQCKHIIRLPKKNLIWMANIRQESIGNNSRNDKNRTAATLVCMLTRMSEQHSPQEQLTLWQCCFLTFCCYFLVYSGCAYFSKC